MKDNGLPPNRNPPPTASLSDEWQDYRRMVVPAGASEAQVRDLEVAFYAGAYVVLQVVVAMGGDDIDDAGAVALLETLYAEAQTFAESVMQKGGGRVPH